MLLLLKNISKLGEENCLNLIIREAESFPLPHSLQFLHFFVNYLSRYFVHVFIVVLIFFLIDLFKLFVRNIFFLYVSNMFLHV